MLALRVPKSQVPSPIDSRFFYHGDPGETVYLPWMCIPMSTAIARIATPEGIVIAADTRSFDKIKRIVISDSTQKIFPISGTRLAYTVGGVATITRGETDEVVFDFSVEIPKALKQSPGDLITINQYVLELADSLYCSLSAANQLAGKPKITEFPPPEMDEFTTIFIDGYYGAVMPSRGPCRSTIIARACILYIFIHTVVVATSAHKK